MDNFKKNYLAATEVLRILRTQFTIESHERTWVIKQEPQGA